MSTRTINIFRWASIVPAGILGFIVICLILNLWNILTSGFNEADLVSGGLVPALSYGAGGFAYIYFALRVAPAHRKKVAIAMIILLGIIILSLFLFQIVPFNFFPSIGALLAIGGSLLGVNVFTDPGYDFD